MILKIRAARVFFTYRLYIYALARFGRLSYDVCVRYRRFVHTIWIFIMNMPFRFACLTFASLAMTSCAMLDRSGVMAEQDAVEYELAD